MVKYYEKEESGWDSSTGHLPVSQSYGYREVKDRVGNISARQEMEILGTMSGEEYFTPSKLIDYIVESENIRYSSKQITSVLDKLEKSNFVLRSRADNKLEFKITTSGQQHLDKLEDVYM